MFANWREPSSLTICNVVVSNLDHLLSVVRVKELLCLKIWGKPLPRNYLCFIKRKLLELTLNYLTNTKCRFDIPATVFGNEPLHYCTKKTAAGCVGFRGLSDGCLLRSSREYHKSFFLEQIRQLSILSLKTWIYNETIDGDLKRSW